MKSIKIGITDIASDTFCTGENIIKCPECGFEYNSFGTPVVIKGNDNYESNVDGKRGDVISIPFNGECGHNWELCLGLHKGNTVIVHRVN